MFRPGLVALQKYVAPASTPSRQVFDIILKSGSISATDLFAKAKDLKAPEGEASVKSKTFAPLAAPPSLPLSALCYNHCQCISVPAFNVPIFRHAKKILQFLASKTFIKAFPTAATPGEKKRRMPFLYRVLPDSKKAQRLIAVRFISSTS